MYYRPLALAQAPSPGVSILWYLLGMGLGVSAGKTVAHVIDEPEYEMLFAAVGGIVGVAPAFLIDLKRSRGV